MEENGTGNYIREVAGSGYARAALECRQREHVSLGVDHYVTSVAQ